MRKYFAFGEGGMFLQQLTEPQLLKESVWICHSGGQDDEATSSNKATAFIFHFLENAAAWSECRQPLRCCEHDHENFDSIQGAKFID
jgi:hypothetical protein